jgi:hypothetical protein
VEINPRFIDGLRQHGATGFVMDLNDGEMLPAADYVIMQASLYQFLPEPGPLIDRLLSAARCKLIIAEPVKNLANSRLGWVAALARRHTDPGTGLRSYRFTERTLDELFGHYASRVCDSFLIAGNREKVYVLDA